MVDEYQHYFCRFFVINNEQLTFLLVVTNPLTYLKEVP